MYDEMKEEIKNLKTQLIKTFNIFITQNNIILLDV